MRIVYDATLKRPACALLQAVLGGDGGVANHFDSEDWLIAPTPGMHTYEVTPDQLKKLVKITKENRKGKI